VKRARLAARRGLDPVGDDPAYRGLLRDRAEIVGEASAAA